MLNIWFGSLEDGKYIEVPSIYFDNSYEDSWILDDFTKRVIKGVDSSEVVDVNCVLSPILGTIPITRISGGAKTVILMNNEVDRIFNASSCGDNCVEWILQIAKEKDITIRLGHIMRFPEDINARILNTQRVVTSYKEYVEEYAKVMTC